MSEWHLPDTRRSLVVFIALFVLYNAINHACPYSVKGEILVHLCETADSPWAALIYKAGSVPFFFVFLLTAFYGTPDRQTRWRLAGLFALAMFVVSLILHIPYFLYPGSQFYWHVDETRAFKLGYLFLFIAWACCHRMMARWEAPWRWLDPKGVVPSRDRHRLIFWHPVIALLFHHMAASTDLWTITWT